MFEAFARCVLLCSGSKCVEREKIALDSTSFEHVNTFFATGESFVISEVFFADLQAD
jgi:hypothetical protein